MKRWILLLLAACTPVEPEAIDPDIWTKHPGLVRDVLIRAGFECGVKPTILPEKNGIPRSPEWTCRYTWEKGYAEFYIHQLKD
ncbi:MAG: hypothetical protein QW165_04260 [Candidatus Woesearchaeota archaeon]